MCLPVLVLSWKTIMGMMDKLASKEVHTVGDLMSLPRSVAAPLLKNAGLQDGQIESLKSILKVIDGEWSDWQAAPIDVEKKVELGRGGKRTLCSEELVDERTTDADRSNYHLPLEFYDCKRRIPREFAIKQKGLVFCADKDECTRYLLSRGGRGQRRKCN